VTNILPADFISNLQPNRTTANF